MEVQAAKGGRQGKAYVPGPTACASVPQIFGVSTNDVRRQEPEQAPATLLLKVSQFLRP